MSGDDPGTVLRPLREEIDAIDDRIVDLLVKRQAVVCRVAEVKRATGFPVVLPERIREVTERNAARAAAGGVDPDHVRRLFGLIIDEACAVERRLTAGAAATDRDATDRDATDRDATDRDEP